MITGFTQKWDFPFEAHRVNETSINSFCKRIVRIKAAKSRVTLAAYAAILVG
jgi:hypothetical protein